MGENGFHGMYDPVTCQFVETKEDHGGTETQEYMEEQESLGDEVKQILEEKQQEEQIEDSAAEQVFSEQFEEKFQDTPMEPETENIGEETLIEEDVTLEDLLIQMQILNSKFDEKILAAEKKDTLSKTLYAELQEYKKGVYASIMKPLIKEMIQVRSNIILQGRKLIEKNGEEASIKVESFLDYADDIANILETYDAQAYSSEEGTEFDAHIHKVLKKIITADINMNKKVAYSMADGYYFDSRVLIKENVAVYMYEPEGNN